MNKLLCAAFIALILPLGLIQEAKPSVVVKKPYVFVKESPNSKNLKKLRRLYGYDKQVQKGKTEFDRMVILKNWVYQNLRYSFKTKYPVLKNSLRIMQLRKKNKFMCASYAALYMQCGQSMGWDVRYIYLRSPNNDQHVATDVWSDVYRKWIYIDTTWNLHVLENGVPLSLPEIRNRWLANQTDAMVFVFGAGKNEKRFTAKNFPYRRKDSELWKKRPVDEKWLAYLYQPAIVGRNDFFSCNEKQIFTRLYIIKDDNNIDDKNWQFRNKTQIQEEILFGDPLK